MAFPGRLTCETNEVTQPRPVVAAFDLDGTLTRGGSVVAWLRFLAGTTKVARAISQHAPSLLLGALLSGETADNAKEALFREVLQGIPEQEARERSASFAAHHLAEELRGDTAARLQWHQAQGHLVVIVSASPELYVNVIAEQLGADGHVGTQLALDPLGRLTGGYLGRNCRGAEKIRRLNEWIATNVATSGRPELYAYGNSRGDRRLLAAAEHPFDAGQLGRWGALRAYPRFSESELQA